MNPGDAFDRHVSEWLHADAEHRLPEHLDAVLRRTGTERQRPAWSSLERWLPMQNTLRLAPAPRIAWLLVVIALLAALGAAALAIGSRQHQLAPPFGLARNGPVVYGAPDGDIYALDPATGVSTVLVTGPTFDLAPDFSRDGSRFAFARKAEGDNRQQLMVANADGTGVRRLSEPLTNLTWFAWSPDSTRLAVISDLDRANALSILAMDGSIERAPSVAAELAQWRADGRELVYRGVGPGGRGFGLYAVGADGSNIRAITPEADSDCCSQAPALSPDGSRIIYTRWDSDGIGSLWLVGVDGGAARRLEFDGPPAKDYYATWSADGTRIVFHRWRGSEYRLAVAPPDGGHAVEIGPAMPESGGAAATAFSPDGASVVARYDPDGSTWILDPTGRSADRRLPASGFVGSWQRLAP